MNTFAGSPPRAKELDNPMDDFYSGKRPRISVLVVEDDTVLAGTIRKCLELFGLRVFLASSGQEALELIQRVEPAIDLLLSDIVLPAMDGFELLKKVSAQWPEIKVMLMSVDPTAEYALARHGMSSVPYVQKPFSPDEIINRIHTVLAGR